MNKRRVYGIRGIGIHERSQCRANDDVLFCMEVAHFDLGIDLDLGIHARMTRQLVYGTLGAFVAGDAECYLRFR